MNIEIKDIAIDNITEELKNVTELEVIHNEDCDNNCLIGAAYIRQSKGEEESIESQINSIDRWKQEAEYNFKKTIHIKYIVTDRTGAWTDSDIPPKRAGYDSLIQLINNKKIDITLAREISRYSRIIIQLLEFLQIARMNKIIVTSKMDSITTDLADQKNIGTVIQILIKAALNSESSRETGKRINENAIPKKECGFWLGGLQTGYFPKGGEYRDTIDEKGREKRELFAPKFPRTHTNGNIVYGKILEPLPNWKQAVNEAATQIITGNTLRSAGLIFEKYGFKVTDKNKIIDTARIRKWLSNPILIGYTSRDETGEVEKNRYMNGLKRLQYVQKDGNGLPVEACEAVMTHERWIDLQHALNRITDSREPKTPFLLQGLLICERCGAKLTRAKTRKEYNYYVCLNTKRVACKGVCISLEKADKYIEEKILERYSTEDIEENALAYEQEKQLLIDKLPNGHAEEIQKLNRQIDILTDLLINEESKTSRNKYKLKIDELAARIDDINTLKITEPKIPNMKIILDGAQVTGYDLKKWWPKLTTQQKNAMLRSAINNILIKRQDTKQNKNEKGKYIFRNERIVIWWRDEEKPDNWDRKIKS